MRGLLSAADDVQAGGADVLGLAPLHEVVLDRQCEEPHGKVLVVLVEVETSGLCHVQHDTLSAARRTGQSDAAHKTGRRTSSLIFARPFEIVISRDSLPNPASPPLTARDPARGVSAAGEGMRSRSRESKLHTCGADEFSHHGGLPDVPHRINTQIISSPHSGPSVSLCARVHVCARCASYPEPESANVTSEMIVFSSSTCRQPPSHQCLRRTVLD